MSILVIVESPGKIQKIQHILGNDYIVMASVGHIIDLHPKEMSIDMKTFQPQYYVLDGKTEVVNKLIKTYNKCDDAYLASDRDREGEMIAWSLARQLKIQNPKRIIFNAITKEEILNAVKKPNKIDKNLVEGQKARRVVDRLIGFSTSPIIRQYTNNSGDSAGRVQSVVVRLILEKENEIEKFFKTNQASFFKVCGEFYEKKPFKAILYKSKKGKDDDGDEDNDEENKDETETGIAKIKNEDLMRNLMKLMMKSKYKVSNISNIESVRNPSAPFTTASLQQEASNKLGMTSKRTMTAAQHLYEAAFITYHRTDSVNLSKEGLSKIGEYVLANHGNKYYRKKNYEAKSKNTQEAHEAIRPTEPETTGINENAKKKIGKDEVNLYKLIWKRAIASQMTPAVFKVTSIKIDISEVKDYYFMTQIENVIFDGFLAVYNMKNIENDNNQENQNQNIVIPKEGTKLNVSEIKSTQEYKRPPARYNDASLVKKLSPENLNIGRPSTYANIIDKIQTKNYVKMDSCNGFEKDSLVLSWDGSSKKIAEKKNKVVLGKDTNKFVITSLGRIVVNFLVENLSDIMDYQFTANMEEDLDKIADGKKSYYDVIKKFYGSFNKKITTLATTTKTKNMKENARVVGTHPKTNNQIIATFAKFGPIVRLLDDKGKKALITAPIKEPLTIETITLKDALKLFEYPRDLGRYEKKPVLLNKGKFGLYLTHGDLKIGLKITEKEVKDYDLETAIQAIKDKKKSILWERKDANYSYAVLNGEYGNYIKSTALKGFKKGASKTCSLPKDIKLEELTLEKARELILKKKRFFGKKKE